VATTVVFYDGVCGLCDRFIGFLIRRDGHRRIVFAPLQGTLAHRALAPHGVSPSDLDTVIALADWQCPSEHVLTRSRAVLHALRELEGIWPALARVALRVPTPLADAAYRVVARFRYRAFGKLDACPVPPREWRDRFLE
jgi:predicted DCC family thiol-disulfide oxidoreductase YuxK